MSFVIVTFLAPTSQTGRKELTRSVWGFIFLLHVLGLDGHDSNLVLFFMNISEKQILSILSRFEILFCNEQSSVKEITRWGKSLRINNHTFFLWSLTCKLKSEWWTRDNHKEQRKEYFSEGNSICKGWKGIAVSQEQKTAGAWWTIGRMEWDKNGEILEGQII